MPAQTAERRADGTALPSAPSDDNRWRIVETRMRKLGRRPDALIEVLHAVQEAFGFLDTESLTFVSDSLGVPLSRVYGVASFYSFFTLKPQGDHTCVICTGTACYITGAGKLIDALAADLGIAPGETTEDQRVSMLTARCIGACSLAPAVVIDGELSGNVTPAGLLEQLAGLAGAGDENGGQE